MVDSAQVPKNADSETLIGLQRESEDSLAVRIVKAGIKLLSFHELRTIEHFVRNRAQHHEQLSTLERELAVEKRRLERQE